MPQADVHHLRRDPRCENSFPASALAAPRTIIAVAVLLVIGAGIFGVHVTKSLSAAACGRGGGVVQVADLLEFGQGDVQMVFTVDSPDGVRGAAARAVGTDIVDQVRTLPYVADAASAWTSPPRSPQA